MRVKYQNDMTPFDMAEKPRERRFVPDVNVVRNIRYALGRGQPVVTPPVSG